MNLNLDIINVLVVIVGLVDIFLGLLVYSHNPKNWVNRSFLIYTIAILLWEVTMLLYRGFVGHDLVLIASRLLYLGAATIPPTFIYFCKTFPSGVADFKVHERFALFFPPLFIFFISLAPNFLIQDVRIIPNAEDFIVFNRFWHAVYGLYISGYFFWSYVILFRKYLVSDRVVKGQLIYIGIGTLISTSVGVITNLLLPTFDVFVFNWLGQVGVIVMVLTITAAILRHHLFNVKVLTTEILVFLLWVFNFVQIFSAPTPVNRNISVILFLVLLVIGVFLVRSVLREVEQRERIERLVKDLSTTADQLFVANEKLKELNKQKTEFVSMASHQLRSPLTAINGYASMLLEGSFGELTKESREAVDRIYDSGKKLARVIEDFLNVTRIELGKMKYEVADFDLATLADMTIKEILPLIQKKKLKLEYQPTKEKIIIHGDQGKIGQVIGNLLDNAIKYTPAGSIGIKVETVGGEAIIKISDTGVGISTEAIKKLFEKFVRADDAGRINTIGTGLGLYVAKQIVGAHHGQIKVESLGVGKGSTFSVILPKIKPA